MTPLELRRYRAERLLRKDFAGLRAKVLSIVRSRLSARGIKLDQADLEACYAQAWHGLYATLLDGEAVESPTAWLVLVAFRRAIDEHRAAGGVGVVDGEDRRSHPRSAGAYASDLAAELDDRARLRHLFEGMRTRLSAREREAASLCYLQGLSRADAAERMGISEGRMRKLMEGTGDGRPGVAGKLGALRETIEAGAWCEQQASLLRAYAFGILDPEGERHALAVAHCRECPACRAHVASLRGLASVLPLPLLPRLAAGGGGIKAGAGANASGSFPASLTAKLAITVALSFGTGYAVLGSRTHGSPRRSSGPAALAPSPVAGVLSHALFALPPTRAHTRVGRLNRRRSTSRSRHTHAVTARGTTPTVATEFGPERASGVAAAAAAAHSAPPAPSPGGGSAAGEFGVE